MILHLDINTVNEYSVCNDVKLSGSVIAKAYFTRNFMKASPSATNNWIVVRFLDGSDYLLTHNQSSTNDEVYIVDTVDTLAPTSLLDLASKLNALMKF